jgi:hypothetical protein
MKASADAARLLRESNPVADDAFSGAAGDSIGRATFEHITGGPSRRAQAAGRSSAPARMTGPVGERHRRLALRWTAGLAAALAAGAVVLVTIVLPGATQNGVDAAAYVVKRVDSALNAAEPGEIAQMTITTRGIEMYGSTAVTTTAQEWSYGDQWRLIATSPGGHPVYDEGFSSSSVYTVVSYQAQTWARQPGLGGPAGYSVTPAAGAVGCGPAPGRPVPGRPVAALPMLFAFGLPGIRASAGSPPATVARDLRAAVACGALAAAGRQRVDGIEAIKLTSRPDSLISETIWVSPSTYLPVRVAVRPGPGAPGPWQTADITWLAPTAHNLARLTVPIPAGFREVPLASAVLPIQRQWPAEPKPTLICLGPAGCKAGTGGYGPPNAARP